MLITIRQRNTYKNVYINARKTTVANLKNMIAQELEVPVDEQRLVLKGRILSDPSLVLKAEEVEGVTIRLVQTNKPAASPSAPNNTGSSDTSAANPSSTMNNANDSPLRMFGNDLNEIPNVFSNLNAVLSNGSGSASAKLFNDPYMANTLQQAGNLARNYLNNPSITSEDSNDMVQTIIRDFINPPEGENQKTQELQDLVQSFCNMEADSVAGVANFLNESGLMEKLPNLIEESVNITAGVAESEGIYPENVARELFTSPNIHRALQGMINTLGDDATPFFFNGKEVDEGSDDSESETSSSEPAEPVINEEVPDDVDENQLDVLCDLGFSNRQKNIAMLRKHDGDVDGVIHELLTKGD